jgi:hypothetical protein
MEALFWILLLLAGVGLYVVFGQHRNRLRFDVDTVIMENDSAFVDGVVRDGWIGLSQHVFFRTKSGIGSAHVIAILAAEKHLRIAKKGDHARLVITGKYLDELGTGCQLVTSKKDA